MFYSHLNCESNIYFLFFKGLAPNTEYRVSVRSKAGKSAPSKSAFNDEKNRKKMEKLTTYVDFRTLPKGLPDPPIDVQVESGPQDGTLLVSWLPVTISATGGTSNGCPVNGYSVYVDGKRMGEIDSPTADHTLLDITSVQPTQVKSVTVRTKSGDSVSADSISCKVPAAVIKGKRKGYDDTADDSSDRDELSDIAEEAEEDLSDTIQAKAAEKKDGRSINKENVDKEKKKSEKRSVKESQSKEVRNSQKSLRSTSKKKSEVIERRNSSDQVVMETEDNLSDKEIIPDMHINIPSIEITKDSASEGRNSIEPFSDEDYDINCSKSQGVSDGRRSERDRQNQQKRVMQNSPVTGSDKCATTYQDKRVTSQVTPQPTPRRSNTGYNNGYGGEEEYSRRESDYNRRDGDYRHDEGHRRDVDYRRDRDYGRRDSEYSRRETGEYSRRHSDYRRETDNIRERERHRPNGPVPYRDQPISNHARLFVALFDYDPQTMSPNPDGADEELPFNEGQIIKIYGDKDNDGFYRGEANGRIGYVPCNMVSEVQAEDEEVAQHLMRNHPPVRPGTQRGRSAGRGDFQERYNQGSGGVRKMVALYDYDPQELSPNFDAEVELSFNTGDIIYVHGDMDEDGFFMGEIGGVRGLVPSNFLTDVPSDYRDNNPHHNELCAGKIIEICTKEEQEQQQPAVECINPNNKEVTADHTHNHHNMHNYHPNDIRQEEGKIREITTTAEDPSSSIQAIEVDHQVQDSTTRKEEMCRLEDRSFHQIHTIPWIEEDLATSSTNVQDMAVEKEEALVHRLAKDNIQKKFTTKGSHSNVEEKEEEEDRSCPAVMDTHHEQGTIRKWGMVPKFLQRQRNNTESVAEEPAKELHTTIQCHQECHMDNPKKSEVNGNSGAIASKDSFSKKGLLRKHSSKRKKAKSGSDDKKAGESDKKNASSSSNRKGVIGFLKGLLPDRLTKKS
ncbi:BZRAP1 (predicted) [Pycnogonum litorale]